MRRRHWIVKSGIWREKDYEVDQLLEKSVLFTVCGYLSMFCKKTEYTLLQDDSSDEARLSRNHATNVPSGSAGPSAAPVSAACRAYSSFEDEIIPLEDPGKTLPWKHSAARGCEPPGPAHGAVGSIAWQSGMRWLQPVITT